MSNIPKKPVIEFEHVVFGYDENITNLDNINFVINENEYICIIGHNGSGKSTISKLMVGLLKPRSGSIKIMGMKAETKNMNLIRKKIGIIFQNPDNQFVGLTVEDDIAFSLENNLVSPSKMKEIIHLVSKATGIQKLLTVPPNQLSGGQKQRVAIASTLSTNPNIIIFDESTAMLDPNAKEDLKKLILDLKNKYKRTIISVTHDMEEITRADRLIIVNKGKILKCGPPSEILSNKEFLTNIALDLPFNLNVCLELNKQNSANAKPYSITIDEDQTIDEICQNVK
ncbi:MAG: energy-coupling factor transporter ATPase [Mycoplasmataceae bacterium]|jgi:energy-coupling factor transport system ATP-binding protein|nr:energy-coupling factor transporter ATPase [Mycoplasmataceae bacterium]